jgi:hypothetical protein
MGHSQGVSQFFLAHTLHPDLYKNYTGFVGIAPVLFVGNLHSALIDTLDKMMGPEIAVSFMDAVLYVHEIFTYAAQFFIKFFPRLSWWITECFGGFDEDTHVNL